MHGLALVTLLTGLAAGEVSDPGHTSFCAATDVGVAAPPVQTVHSPDIELQTPATCSQRWYHAAGIGLEYLVAQLAIAPCQYASLWFYDYIYWHGVHDPGEGAAWFTASYTVSASLVGGTSAWATSRVFGEKRAWWKAAAGAAAGSFASSLLYHVLVPRLDDPDNAAGLLLLLGVTVGPAIGAVAGLNL